MAWQRESETQLVLEEQQPQFSEEQERQQAQSQKKELRGSEKKEKKRKRETGKWKKGSGGVGSRSGSRSGTQLFASIYGPTKIIPSGVVVVRLRTYGNHPTSTRGGMVRVGTAWRASWAQQLGR